MVALAPVAIAQILLPLAVQHGEDLVLQAVGDAPPTGQLVARLSQLHQYTFNLGAEDLDTEE